MKFEIGKEYKTIKRNLEVGVRTFTVTRISHKNMAVEVKGAINGIYRMKLDNKGNEMICLTMSNTQYCNPSALDIIK